MSDILENMRKARKYRNLDTSQKIFKEFSYTFKALKDALERCKQLSNDSQVPLNPGVISLYIRRDLLGECHVIEDRGTQKFVKMQILQCQEIVRELNKMWQGHFNLMYNDQVSSLEQTQTKNYTLGQHLVFSDIPAYLRILYGELLTASHWDDRFTFFKIFGRDEPPSFKASLQAIKTPLAGAPMPMKQFVHGQILEYERLAQSWKVTGFSSAVNEAFGGRMNMYMLGRHGDCCTTCNLPIVDSSRVY